MTSSVRVGRGLVHTENDMRRPSKKLKRRSRVYDEGLYERRFERERDAETKSRRGPLQKPKKLRENPKQAWRKGT